MDMGMFLLGISALTAGLIATGIIRNRRFKRRQDQHQQLASRLGMQLAYMNEQQATWYGNYRSYPLRIETVLIPVPGPRGRALHRPALRFALPMHNPSLNALRIARRHPDAPWLDSIAQPDRPMTFAHGIAPWLDIQSNNMLFASLVLSEDLKISLYDVFSRLEAGLMFIYDDEMVFLYPGLLPDSSDLSLMLKIADLLCDTKDQLN
ncbi:MAG: hypothetical protein NW241_20420 [Bacteroidia bacterium]|nr:hypothetical protein [Bacteroidia bacterium]